MSSKYLMNNNPYIKYVDDRTKELLKSFVIRCGSSDKTAWLKFISKLCQSLAMNEADIIENQAVLNDPSPYKNGSRDELLKMFGKQFIDSELSDSNRTYKDFDKRRYMNSKDGDNE